MITVTLKINVSFRSLEDWILNNGVYKSSQFINKDGYYKDSPNFAFMGFVQDPNNLNRFTAIAIYIPERKDDPVEHVPEAIILNVFSETTNRQRVTVECGNWDNYLWFVSCFVAAVMDEWPRHARVSAWSVFKINPSEEREPERLFQEHMEKLKSSSAELAPIEDGFIDPDDEDEPAAVNKNGEGTVMRATRPSDEKIDPDDISRWGRRRDLSTHEVKVIVKRCKDFQQLPGGSVIKFHEMESKKWPDPQDSPKSYSLSTLQTWMKKSQFLDT